VKLKLNGLEVECIIGERPDERNRLQKLLVDVELDVSDVAAQSDCLSDAVDYAELVDKIRDKLVSARCHLIERAAKEVYDLLPTKLAKVTVTKRESVPGLSSASAVYPSTLLDSSELP
jgi:dihydroneopterin aldolase